MADFKQTTVRLTKLELDKQSVLMPQAEGSADAPAADATLTFHTIGGDQSVKVKIVSWKQLKKKARITIVPGA